VSHYQLTLEPNTLFAVKPPALPDEDSAWDMQEACQQRLAEAGYEQYEVSAYARDRLRSRHNLNYWRFGDYLGIGAGAHGKLSFPDRVTRHERAKQPRDYMEKPGFFEKVVDPADLPFEFMLNALRLVGGFDVGLFSERTGLASRLIENRMVEAESRGLLERDWKRIRPTMRGQRFLNELLETFLTADRRSPAPASG
jgi:oxygen-independent coproporphyrinogen-3 oxidase